ncbi:limonene hydroxylase [Paenibacillus sp. alder61]|uniref:limonene hydroxylase n=1 Tax=Paenibacillus sp. alder61 TaxID=2862948 RepID=UPI001CD4A66E|nr:limonene hydroxylase [Paenibacillus sp. alder61]MCA1292236.1 limonene hydroxylase [Paenibacillus sp. alder61]
MVIFLDKAVRPLWEGKTSIYSYIRKQGEAVDGSLPDDEEFWAGSKFRWVAGGLDGALGHHAMPSEKKEKAQELARRLAKHSRKPKNATRKLLYAELVGTDIRGMIDDILAEVRQMPGIRPGAVFDEAVWLAEHGAHRNAVKFGIALLGLFQNEDVKDLLLTLGRHDEFTLYAAVAIQNGMEDSNEVLFELAKQVHGWGKIHLVERLEPASEEIRDWLLRQGCQNSVMNEYLACICARNGGLHEALAADRVDAALFDGATDIIEALLSGGPAEDIDDYEHAPQVLSDYVRLAREMSTTVRHLSVMLGICDFLALADEEDKWAARMSAGWTGGLRADLREAAQSIAADSKWASLVIEAVRSGGTSERYYGAACAEKLGIEVWDVFYEQLAANPLQDYHFYQLMKSEDPERIRKLVEFAVQHLPLEQIATGPADEMGLGEKYAAHSCLDHILQRLDQYEGLGGELILTGLNSPVVRNRNMALRALEGWSVASWGERLVEAVIHLSQTEPDDSVKESLHQLREAKGIYIS